MTVSGGLRTVAEPSGVFDRTGLCLWTAAVLATACILPYALALAPAQLAHAVQQTGMPAAALVALSLLQSAILLAVATFGGLWAARRLGLGAPLLQAALRGQRVPYPPLGPAAAAAVLGVVASLVIVGLDAGVFAPALRAGSVAAPPAIAPWKGALASLYGGIAEEIELRLFLLSWIALAGRAIAARLAGAREPGALTPGVFWAANVVAAVLFGLGHLPATAEIMPLTPLVVTRAIVLNGLLGLIAGYLYWRRGIEMAMLCHFSGDLVLHVAVPAFTVPG